MSDKKAKKIFIYGTSGHAEVCAEILELQGFTVAGFIAKDESEVGKQAYSIPVVSHDADAHVLQSLRSGTADYFIAIGDNAARRRLADQLYAATGCHPVNAIHPHIVISPSAAIGRGNFINAGAIINVHAVIGNNAIINTSATIDHDDTIEDYAQISPGCNLAGAVTIGAGSFIGTGAIILPGITIGEGSIVGAGAVVTKDIPEHVLAVGCPAVIKKSL